MTQPEGQAPGYLFVYGSLMRDLQDGQRQRWMQDAVYRCKGSFPGLLYEVTGYPGAIHQPKGTGRVQGELFEITAPSLLDTLDRYEECHANDPQPHPYIRQTLEIDCEDGQMLPAWVYLYRAGIQGLTHIEDGDYARWVRTHRAVKGNTR